MLRLLLVLLSSSVALAPLTHIHPPRYATHRYTTGAPPGVRIGTTCFGNLCFEATTLNNEQALIFGFDTLLNGLLSLPLLPFSSCFLGLRAPAWALGSPGLAPPTASVEHRAFLASLSLAFICVHVLTFHCGSFASQFVLRDPGSLSPSHPSPYCGVGPCELVLQYADSQVISRKAVTIPCVSCSELVACVPPETLFRENTDESR